MKNLLSLVLLVFLTFSCKEIQEVAVKNPDPFETQRALYKANFYMNAIQRPDIESYPFEYGEVKIIKVYNERLGEWMEKKHLIRKNAIRMEAKPFEPCPGGICKIIKDWRKSNQLVREFLEKGHPYWAIFEEEQYLAAIMLNEYLFDEPLTQEVKEAIGFYTAILLNHKTPMIKIINTYLEKLKGYWSIEQLIIARNSEVAMIDMQIQKVEKSMQSVLQKTGNNKGIDEETQKVMITSRKRLIGDYIHQKKEIERISKSYH